MYSTFERLLKERNLKVSDVAKGTGIRPSTFTDWKKGLYTPKIDKMIKISEFLEVPVDLLMSQTPPEQLSTSGNRYYFDDATAEKAQELFENQGMRILFDAARNSRPEDLQMAADLLKRLKETNPDG